MVQNQQTDWRELCSRMAEELDIYRIGKEGNDKSHPLAREAREALSQSEPEVVEPSDAELDSLERQYWEETGVEEWGRREAIFNHRAFARAAIARYGRPAPAPAGEVGELVQELRNVVTAYKSCHNQDSIWSLLGGGVNARLTVTLLTRSADLLEQRQGVPVPVAVSERLPGAEDCDAEGRCWWWRTDDADEWWEFLCITDAREYNAGCGSARYTHWLPFNALPLPSGEVEFG